MRDLLGKEITPDAGDFQPGLVRQRGNVARSLSETRGQYEAGNRILARTGFSRPCLETTTAAKGLAARASKHAYVRRGCSRHELFCKYTIIAQTI